MIINDLANYFEFYNYYTMTFLYR